MRLDTLLLALSTFFATLGPADLRGFPHRALPVVRHALRGYGVRAAGPATSLLRQESTQGKTMPGDRIKGQAGKLCRSLNRHRGMSALFREGRVRQGGGFHTR